MEARAEVAARVAVEREEAEVEAARLAVRAGAATVEAMAVEVTVEAVRAVEVRAATGGPRPAVCAIPALPANAVLAVGAAPSQPPSLS